MMRCNSFARSALFAAVAALGWLPWALVAVPLVGVWNARAGYFLGIMVLYIAAISPRGRQRLSAAALSGLVIATLALAAHTAAELVIGSAVILGVARSGFLYRSAPARALVTEAGLLVGGVVFARFLSAATLFPTALGIWGFLLVQSLFFLVAGVRERSPRGRHADPFEEVYQRATVLLERMGV